MALVLLKMDPDFILKFNQIVVLNSLPESNPKPEVENPKPEVMGYEKPDPTRNPRKVYPLMPYC